MNADARLLLITLIAVVGLILLVARFKLSAFLALVIASLFVGVGARMNLGEIAGSFQDGMGSVLGSIAAVVGFGTILGKLLAESGGARVVATTLVSALGIKRLHWAMLIIGLIIGLPTWFTIGLVLVMPIVFNVARDTGTPLLKLALPLVAGLSVAHGLIPPHPGPMAAIGLLKADTGKVILYSILIGFPTAFIAGPLWTRWITRYVSVEPGAIAELLTRKAVQTNLPGFGLTVFTIVLPVLLMLAATVADVTLVRENGTRQFLDFIGSPLVAMLAAVLFALYSFGFARGFDKHQLLKFCEECLGPVAPVLLVVGAGGGFNRILIASGVGGAIANLAKGSHVSPFILGWLVAALIRVATGSATVAITAAAGIMAPIVAGTPGIKVELLVVAMGAGSLTLSHVNDGGFWFVKEYLNLSVPQALKSWTVMETIISIIGLILAMALNSVI